MGWDIFTISAFHDPRQDFGHRNLGGLTRRQYILWQGKHYVSEIFLFRFCPPARGTDRGENNLQPGLFECCSKLITLLPIHSGKEVAWADPWEFLHQDVVNITPWDQTVVILSLVFQAISAGVDEQPALVKWSSARISFCENQCISGFACFALAS